MKLSEAIRKGIPITPESKGYAGCALSAACMGAAGFRGWDIAYSMPGKYGHEVIAERFGWNIGLCERVSSKFTNGELSREQCVDYAEKWEREHAVTARESDTAYYVRQMAEIQRVTVDA